MNTDRGTPLDAPGEVSFDASARVWLVSDLHLWLGRAHTAKRFASLVEHACNEADALFILGDLFEYWAGDDDLDSAAVRDTVALLREATTQGLAIRFMHGNRDFLVGERFAAATGARLIDDPCMIHLGRTHALVSHGDALCTDDVEYQKFRAMVRSPAYQAAFLAKPLTERHAIIATMRAHSERKKEISAEAIMDVNPDAVSALMIAHQASLLIHGHTHRPARHESAGLVRWVLPDWEFDATDAPRGGALQLDESGVRELAV